MISVYNISKCLFFIFYKYFWIKSTNFVARGYYLKIWSLFDYFKNICVIFFIVIVNIRVIFKIEQYKSVISKKLNQNYQTTGRTDAFEQQELEAVMNQLCEIE